MVALACRARLLQAADQCRDRCGHRAATTWLVEQLRAAVDDGALSPDTAIAVFYLIGRFMTGDLDRSALCAAIDRL